MVPRSLNRKKKSVQKLTVVYAEPKSARERRERETGEREAQVEVNVRKQRSLSSTQSQE